MRMKEAVVKRFQQLCRERNIKLNELATLSGVTPSTVYSMMDESRKDVSVITVKKLCDGLDISIPEFYSDPIFENLEQESYEEAISRLDEALQWTKGKEGEYETTVL